MEQASLLGQTILGYTVVSQIGSGAFGTVYKAVKSTALGEYTRALKHITFPTARQYASVLNSMGGDATKADGYFAETLRNIATEVELLSSLSETGSTHIVRYYESDLATTDSPRRYDVFVLMEFATPLERYIAEAGRFTVGDVVRMGLEVLEGIEVCHDNGVIHRDVKEDNIFVSSGGQFKIGDFGVSKMLKDSSRAESLKGTPNYLAPEVYLGRGGYTKSVDLYSLGIVLYRLLNHGRNPFLPPFPESYYAEDEDKAFERRMRGETPGLPALGGVAIGSAVVKAVSADAQRYQSAASFALALKSALMATPEGELARGVGGMGAHGGFAAAAPESLSGTGSTLGAGIGGNPANSGLRWSSAQVLGSGAEAPRSVGGVGGARQSAGWAAGERAGSYPGADGGGRTVGQGAAHADGGGSGRAAAIPAEASGAQDRPSAKRRAAIIGGAVAAVAVAAALAFALIGLPFNSASTKNTATTTKTAKSQEASSQASATAETFETDDDPELMNYGSFDGSVYTSETLGLQISPNDHVELMDYDDDYDALFYWVYDDDATQSDEYPLNYIAIAEVSLAPRYEDYDYTTENSVEIAGKTFWWTYDEDDSDASYEGVCTISGVVVNISLYGDLDKDIDEVFMTAFSAV